MLFKNLKRRRFEKEASRKVRILNRKLGTSFSYALLIEETNVLKMIPREDDNTYLRNEHLSNVLTLLEKGLNEDYKNRKKRKESIEDLEDLFDDVKKAYIDYLKLDEVLDDKMKVEPSDLESVYETRYEKYTEFDKEDRETKINQAKELVDNFNNNLSYLKNPEFASRTGDKLIKLKYYGPMSHYKALKKISDNKKKIEKKKNNPFNHYRMYSWYFFLMFLKRKQEKEAKNKAKEYFKKQLNLEKIRLDIERYRIDNSKKNYDYYFDCFLWRTLNDVSYIYKKEIGGITKVIDLVKATKKEKGLSAIKDKERIVVDIKEMETTLDYSTTTKVNGGKSNNGALDIKELNEEISKNVQKEIINEQVREMTRRR